VSDLLAQLREAFGDALHCDAATLAQHRRDTWVLNELRDLEGKPGPNPLAVVEPRDTAEVARLLRICRRTHTAVVPFGGGSGVCGAVQVPEGAVVLSTARMSGLVALDDVNLLATFRAGTNGMQAERQVEEAGLTIGHWPQSIELSTVGGWVATRAAGQYSTAYGNIEDVLMDLEAVLPDGSVLRTRRTPRASAGPDLRHLMLGCEGTLGIVTETTFSLRPLPDMRRGQAFHYADLASGLEALRLLMRAGHRPPVIRLYDASESQRLFGRYTPEGRALLILLHEGAEERVAVEVAGSARICREAGGTAGDPSAVDDWLQERNHVPGFRGFLEKGIILDTVEVACTWDRVGALYRQVTSALAQVEGLLVASAHSSHSYRSGTNLYFTFVARPKQRAQMAETYTECWRRIMLATMAVGGGISHHHGIGRVRRGFLEDEIGATGLALLRTLKRALDPESLLNPGALLPPLSPPEG